MKLDGQRMRALREEHFWTQRDLAERAGISHPTVVSAEREDSISPTTARKIAETLRVKPKDLLPGKAEAPKKSGRSEAEFEAAIFEMRRVFKLIADPEARKAAERSFSGLLEIVDERRDQSA